MRLVVLWVGMLGLVAVAGAPAGRAAPERAGMVPGPVPADVVSVIDGDTIRVKARIWLGQEIEVMVRLAGIDAPELHGPCAAERRGAEAAREGLTALAGRRILLYDIRNDKYGGRVLARVTAPDGTDLARRLDSQSLVRPYDGGRRGSWCG
jgi:endonuclease YncB( thermonuclease family)